MNTQLKVLPLDLQYHLFLPREEPVEEEETAPNSVEELTQMYARLDPEIQRIIPFKEYYETKMLASHNK